MAGRSTGSENSHTGQVAEDPVDASIQRTFQTVHLAVSVFLRHAALACFQLRVERPEGHEHAALADSDCSSLHLSSEQDELVFTE